MNIPLDKIDDPVLAMRTDVQNDDLETLKSDMAAHGLIEPIVVRPVGERYEIIAGHRRTTAARQLGWAEIKAEVIEATDEQAFNMRLIENISRHDVDPVDEAIFIARIMQDRNLDVPQLADMVRRSEGWVYQRLAIIDMPDYLQEHLKYKRISLGAALELADIEREQDRRYLSNYAAQNGVSVAQARRWKNEVNSRPRLSEEQLLEIGQTEPPPNEVTKTVRCFVTGERIPLVQAETVWVKPGLRPLYEGSHPPHSGGGY